jgi:hypothetical protein
VNEQVPPAAGRVLGIGTRVTPIAVGAILRFDDEGMLERIPDAGPRAGR